MGDACCLFGHAAVFVNVVQVLANLDKAYTFVAFHCGAVYAGGAALTIVAFAIPAVESEGDVFGVFVEKSRNLSAVVCCVSRFCVFL